MNQSRFPWRWRDVQTLPLQKYFSSTALHIPPLLLVAWLNPVSFTNRVETLVHAEAFPYEKED